MNLELPPSTRFRPFKVIGKKAENRLISSFLLEPLDASDWKPFMPGQFLVLRLPAADGGHILRHYSISSDPVVEGCYRISVKREEAPRAGLPDGLGSCHLHRNVEVGAILDVGGPHGAFRLDQASRRPLVLLSGGVGVTPLLSMLHGASRDPDRAIFFIHACLDGSVHAFPDEVRQAAARRDGIHIHTIYERPRLEDRGQYQAEGLVDRALLQTLLPLDNYDFYLCGPSPFMQAVYALLRDLGVGRDRIAYEFFGPSALLEPAAMPAPAPTPSVPPSAPGNDPMAARTVSFARSGHVAPWTGEAGSLLELAEMQGLRPDFSCRAGICGACSARLLSGEVDYSEEPLNPPAAGRILLCCSQPRGAIAIDL